jgi:ATP-dependent Clp protease ATP-binding subunit ClpB
MIQSMAGDDPALIKTAVMAEVKTQFRPEFVNRIDEIVVFHALDEKHIRDIAKIQLRYLSERLAKMEIRLDVTESALAELAKAGFDPVYGARPLKRAIQQSIENPLAKLLLEGRFGPKDTIRVEWTKGGMSFEKAARAQREAA